MHHKTLVLAAALVTATLSASSLHAQETGARTNDQQVVIGAGIGGHAFSPTHRAGQDVEIVVKSAFMQQLYAEWYALDTIGFGVRLITFGTTASASGTVTVGGSSASYSSEADLDVNNLLFTAHWIPLGANRYARIGVLGGLGVSDYQYTETIDPGADLSRSTSGPVLLAGAYVDWGADGFGARVGMQFLATDLDAVNGESVDASGRDVYVDLRWAF